MKETTFFTLIGCLSVISLASGIIGYFYAKQKEEKHGKPSTFRDVYEDNAPKHSNREIDDYAEDCGRAFPY